MQKKILYLLLTIFILSQFNSCEQISQKIESEKIRIVLVHPHAWYLESLVYLVENKIIDIPNLEFQAVFYDRVPDRFESASEFIKSSGIDFVSLTEINGQLNRDNLFKKNDLSDEFYEIFENSSGILFLGGADIPPATYSNKTNLLTSITTPNRHLFELSFLFHLFGGNQNREFKSYLEESPEYVIYGFCLGMQTMNTSNGGTLLQDIPSEVYGHAFVEDVLDADRNTMHRNYWTNLSTDADLNYHNFHQIHLMPGQFFIDKLKMSEDKQPFVCSSHHQAAAEIGPDFNVAATSVDGKIVEAIHHKKYPNVLGVQFHPEFSTLYDPESPNLKFSPTDSVSITEYEVLKKKNSLEFHLKFWQYFSALF